MSFSYDFNISSPIEYLAYFQEQLIALYSFPIIDCTETETTLTVKSSSELSAGNLATIQNYINSYTPPTEGSVVVLYNIQQINNLQKYITNAVYTTAGSFTYKPDFWEIVFLNVIEVHYFFVDNKTPTSTTYKLRIYDVSNNNVICETTNLTTNGYCVFSFDTFSNLPTTKSVFEIQALLSDTEDAELMIDSVVLRFYEKVYH